MFESNNNISVTYKLNYYIPKSPPFIKILGGNRLSDVGSNLTFNSTFRDLDIEDSSLP